MYQNPMENHDFLAVANLLRQKPHASARLSGTPVCPILRGVVRLYPMPRGVLLAAEVTGLPQEDFLDLELEGDIPLPPLLSHRGRSLQVMVAGGCTVEDMMGRIVTIERDGALLGKGTICP
ncbi:MAG: hypothetical protein IKB65_03325 [Ruminiclostridium sp.]|nr:hypothetical protein [Ruminiclostridium sp.]